MKKILRVAVPVLMMAVSFSAYAASGKKPAKQNAPVAMPAAESIAIVVNQDAISVSDLNDRMRLILVSSGLPPKEEVLQKLRPQIVNSLIEEQLKLQEAKRLDITVSDAEIQEGFATLAKQNNFPADKFIEALKQSGINTKTMENQIRAQVGWGKVVQKQHRPRVVISESDIDSFIKRIQDARGKQEYNVAEIVLPVEANTSEGDVLQLANRITQEAREKKGSFFKLAQQFSRSPGAPQGGNLGWIQQGQLDPELESTLAAMQKEEVSNPIRTTSGFHILLLRDARMISDESIPPREKVEQALGLQRLERMQARHLLNLKSAAFIETRV